MKPERKIVAAAVATLVAYALQVVAGVDVPVGVEGALAVIAAYLMPADRPDPWVGPLTGD